MSKLFISCDEATTICDKNQYGEASISDKFKITLHMVMCKVCKCYSSQNTIMTKMFGNHSNNVCKKEKFLSDEDKMIMDKSLKEKMEVPISEK